MTVEGPLRQQIYDSIKSYLFQFESYSRAISEIQKLCDIPQHELAMLPKEMQEIKRKQKMLSEEIIEEGFKFKNQVNQEKQNTKKIEKLYQNINDLKVKLLEIDERLKMLSQTRDSAKACDETGPEVKNALSTQFKIVLDKLKDAQKNFPDIYIEVERETRIHFFTPLD